MIWIAVALGYQLGVCTYLGLAIDLELRVITEKNAYYCLFHVAQAFIGMVLN